LYGILRRNGRVRVIEVPPMEENWMEVPEDQIRTYMSELSAFIDGKPACVVLNKDELGHQDWADRMDSFCCIPAEYMDPSTHVAAPRRGKGIAVLACRAADGSNLSPGVVRARKMFEDALVPSGLTPAKVEIYHQDRSFVDMVISQDWFRDLFIPEVNRRRTMLNYDGPVFLRLDNCSVHDGAEFHDLCRVCRIVAFFVPPHSSHFV
jgi:hypothetical protein